ncbi:MAG: S26 family signal peptidase [Planctomycetota bacterium]
MFRRLAHTLIAAAALVIAARGFFVLGLVAPLQVEGSSMATSLLGRHAEFACEACGEVAHVGADQLPLDGRFSCPACAAVVERADKPLSRGDRILVDRTSATPRRWDRFVLRRPDDSSTLCVKRVLGLPGERVDFRCGDLWIDERVVRKTLDQQRAARVLIDDDDRSWLAIGAGWKRVSSGWRHSPVDGASGSLAFRDASGVFIDDGLACNQAVSRRLNRVADLMLTAQVALARGSSCTIEIDLGGELVRAVLDDKKREARLLAIGGDSQRSRVTALPSVVAGSSLRILLSTFDRHAVLGINDCEVSILPLQAVKTTDSASRLSVFASPQAKVGIEDLAVWRDVYYEWRPTDFRPASKGGQVLGPDEWFVVGDNQAVSDDSRSWRSPALGRLLVGRVAATW